MRSRLIPFGLALLVLVFVSVVLRDFVREAIVVPLSYAIWLASLFFESLPQLIVWAFFLALALLIVGISLIPGQKPKRKVREAEPDRGGQVAILARRIDLAARGYYFRWHLAQRLRALTLDAMGYRERLTPEQLKQQLDAGQLDVPPEIQAYLQAELAIGSISRISQLRHRFRRDAQTSPLDLDPEKVVGFLEMQVEVRRDHR